MRSWIIFAVLAFIAHAAPDGDAYDWEVYKTDVLYLFPNSCDTVAFEVNQQSAYKLTVQPREVPLECSLEDDVRMSSKMYYKGECLEYDWQGDKCENPSGSGIERKEQMCDNWSDLSTAPFTSSSNVSTGLMCFNGDDYFLSLRSECASLIKFDIKVETRQLSQAEDSMCDLLENFFKGAAALAVVFVIFFFLVPILCITGGIIACCCLCPGCPCYWNKKNMANQTQIGQPVGYVNQPAYTANQNVYSNQPAPYGGTGAYGGTAGAYASAPYGPPQGYGQTPFAQVN